MRLTLLLILVLVSACDREPLMVIRGNTMGTTYSVKIMESPVPEDPLKAEIAAELVRVNSLMSTYLPDSELSRLNRGEINEWVHLSTDTLQVINLGLKLSALSAGSFDMTVGPLVNLWGFGPGAGSDRVPTDEEIKEAKARVGYQFIEVRENTLRKTMPVYIDLSALAKGYGVDRVVVLLEKHGIDRYLVEIGGELRARGLNQQGVAWTIAIERPDTGQRSPYGTLGVNDYAVATSGDYRNYFEVDGVRYSHTIDPGTGRPINHNLASVSVLAETTALADGLATTLNVMGADRGFALAEEQNIAALFIIKEDQGFREIRSTAFKTYVPNKP